MDVEFDNGGCYRDWLHHSDPLRVIALLSAISAAACHD
jgi:hypothetical protein